MEITKLIWLVKRAKIKENKMNKLWSVALISDVFTYE